MKRSGRLDNALISLASTVATALINTMFEPGWLMKRNRMAEILGGGDPARTEQAAWQLDADRDCVRRDRTSRATVEGRWQGRLETLLETNPSLASELRSLINGMVRELPSSAATVEQHVQAQGTSTVTQIGRDYHIAGRDYHTTARDHYSVDAGRDQIGRDKAGRDIKRTYNFGGILAIVAVAVVLIIVGGWGIKSGVAKTKEPRMEDLAGMWQLHDYTGLAGEHFNYVLLAFDHDGMFTMNFSLTAKSSKDSGAYGIGNCAGRAVLQDEGFTLQSTEGGCNPFHVKLNGGSSLQLSGGSLPTPMLFKRNG